MSDFVTNLIRRGAGLTPRVGPHMPSEPPHLSEEAVEEVYDLAPAIPTGSDEATAEASSTRPLSRQMPQANLPDSISTPDRPLPRASMTSLEKSMTPFVEPRVPDLADSPLGLGREVSPARKEGMAPGHDLRAALTVGHRRDLALTLGEEPEALSASIRPDAPIAKSSEDSVKTSADRAVIGYEVQKTETETSRLAPSQGPLESRYRMETLGPIQGILAEDWPEPAALIPGDPRVDELSAESPLRPRGASGDGALSTRLDAVGGPDDAEQPRVQVRIGRVEVRMPQPAQAPPPRFQPPRPIERNTLARRYLDRSWY